jgi:hypothetical protein
MNAHSKRGKRLWLFAVIAMIGLMLCGARRAYAQQELAQTLKHTFQLHGYLENQEIIRSENYDTDYNVAQIRNRIDLQPSGKIIEDAALPTVMGVPLGTGFSMGYFAEIRAGYEGVYDLVPDRFGNHTTGFSGIGVSLFDSTGQTAGLALVRAFGYDPRRFKGVVARTLLFPEPVSQNIRFIDRINGVPAACWHCINVQQTVSNLRFERDDTNLIYYPLREGYFDFRWDFFGANLLRVGKQQIVWGKSDFFRLQDIVNPIDFGQHFFIEPFEDTRIPQLAAWLQHRFGDALGFQDIAGNVVWNFDEFNPVGLGVGGQPWAVNFGDQKRAFAFSNGLFDAGECNGSRTPGVCNPNHVNFGLYRERVPDWRLRNDGVGMKWDFQLPHPAIRFALTDWWGIGQSPVFVLGTLQALGNASRPGMLSSGSNFPASGVNCSKIATLTKGFPGFYGPGGGNLPIIATQGRWVQLAKGVNPRTFLNDCTFGGGSEIRYHRDNTLGLSADYFEPFTGVIVRVESSWTHNALVNDTDSLDWTANNDILQYVVGIDRPHFIRFLNPDDSFFTSFQVFETYYPGAHSSNGGKDGIVTGVNDFTFTAFTQTHYYRDQVIPLIFATFGTEGTDSTIGGNTEWLITDHWSASIGFDAFLGKLHQHNIGPNAAFQAGHTAPQDTPYSESIFGPSHMQAGGAQGNKDDEFWTRIRYRF